MAGQFVGWEEYWGMNHDPNCFWCLCEVDAAKLPKTELRDCERHRSLESQYEVFEKQKVRRKTLNLRIGTVVFYATIQIAILIVIAIFLIFIFRARTREAGSHGSIPGLNLQDDGTDSLGVEARVSFACCRGLRSASCN